MSPSNSWAEKWLARAISRFGDIFDYSKVEYINSSTKVIITCSLHGDFKQFPIDHINSKHGCPKCGTLAGVKVCLDQNPDHFSNAGRIGNQRDLSVRYQAALKTKQTRVMKGDWTDDCELDKWKRYKRDVNRLTRRVTRRMNLSNIGRTNNDLQVDHIVSKLEGFKQGVDPDILSHPANLRIIPATENRAKSSQSGMSVEELKRKIREHDSTKRYP